MAAGMVLGLMDILPPMDIAIQKLSHAPLEQQRPRQILAEMQEIRPLLEKLHTDAADDPSGDIVREMELAAFKSIMEGWLTLDDKYPESIINIAFEEYLVMFKGQLNRLAHHGAGPIHRWDVELALKSSTNPCTVMMSTSSQADCFFSLFNEYDITLGPQFTIQSPYKADGTPQPQIMSLSKLEVTPTNRNVIPGRSYSRIGLLATGHISESVPLHDEGFAQPKQILNTIKTMTRRVSTSTGHTLGTLSAGHNFAEVNESQNDHVTPKWIVAYENSVSWDEEGKSYREQQVSYTPTSNREQEMHVEFAMGFNSKESLNDDQFKVSFIIQNQTFLWINDKSLGAQPYVIVVVTSWYIPDIRTSTPLRVVEHQEVEVAANSLINLPPTDRSPISDPASVSLAIGVMPAKNKLPLFRRLANKLTVTSLIHRNQPAKSQILKLQLHELKAQGWDTVTEQWRMPKMNSAGMLQQPRGQVIEIELADFSKSSTPQLKGTLPMLGMRKKNLSSMTKSEGKQRDPGSTVLDAEKEQKIQDPGPKILDPEEDEEISANVETAEQFNGGPFFTPHERLGPETSSAESDCPASIETESTSAPTSISTFIIYSPQSTQRNLSSLYAAISAEDIQGFKARVPQGTPVSSVHSPGDALHWVEAHYDHTLLQAIRAHGLGGPIAAMLSPDEPALAIFGSILDSWAHKAAKLLADVSSFMVMIRPFADDPTQWCLAPDAMEDEENTSIVHMGEDSATLSTVASEDDVESDESDTTESDTRSINIGSTGVFRLRGGAGKEKYIPWTSLEHSLDMCWDLKSGDEVYKVDLLSKIQFTVQSKYADAVKKITRPQAISKTKMKIIPRHRNMKADRSYSRIAFVADAYISDCMQLPSDAFSRPNQTTKVSVTEGNQKTGTASFLIGMTPNVAGTFGLTHSDTKATENQNDRVTPKWIVEYEDGDRSQMGSQYYSAQNISYMATDCNQRGIDVEFSVGINVRTQEPMNNDLPKTGFIIQNQTIMWLSNKNLKAGGHGIIILTTAYIEDIETKEELWIQESQNVELPGGSLINPPATDTNPAPYNAQLSLAVAVPPLKNETNLLKRLSDKLVREFLNDRKKVPLDPRIPKLRLHELKARGWDEGTQDWRMPAFPNLTSALARAIEHSSAHVWNLEMPDLSTNKMPDAKGKQHAEADTVETAVPESRTEPTNPGPKQMENSANEEHHTIGTQRVHLTINNPIESKREQLDPEGGTSKTISMHGGTREGSATTTEFGTSSFLDSGTPSTNGLHPTLSGTGSTANSLTSNETHDLGGQLTPHAGASKA